MFKCVLCGKEYEVKNPSVVYTTNEGEKFIRCPRDNGYCYSFNEEVKEVKEEPKEVKQPARRKKAEVKEEE